MTLVKSSGPWASDWGGKTLGFVLMWHDTLSAPRDKEYITPWVGKAYFRLLPGDKKLT